MGENGLETSSGAQRNGLMSPVGSEPKARFASLKRGSLAWFASPVKFASLEILGSLRLRTQVRFAYELRFASLGTKFASLEAVCFASLGKTKISRAYRYARLRAVWFAWACWA